MQNEIKFATRTLLFTAAVAFVFNVVSLPAAFAADDAVDQAEVQARQVWRDTMHDLAAPESGCFHAAFPSTAWEKVECAEAPTYRSAVPVPQSDTTGNGYDAVAQTPKGHYFSSVVGSFPEISGLKSEKGVGVALFGGGGVLGPNEYTLQLNTDIHHSAACAGYKNCQAWQQYVFASNYEGFNGKLTGKAQVFIEYWLFNYGVHNGNHDVCPKGFVDAGRDSGFGGTGDDCVQNTPAAVVSSKIIPITKLADLELSGSAKSGGTDQATAIFGKDAYKASVRNSLTDISAVWNQAEFNVVGNADGSEAVFNKGTALLVKMALTYGSTKAPTFIQPNTRPGTTGESNNLTITEYAVDGGSKPVLEFVESN